MADISKIKLPSGNEYDIKDATARQLISGGVSFNIVWTATNYASTSTPSAAKLAEIPAGVVVYYNNGASSATGTLTASNNTVGKFYLIYSKSQAGTLDTFDEYVTIGESPNQTWEKIGDTLLDLTGLVTGVTLNKQTDSAIGTDATFTVTQPTVSLATGASGDGKVQVATNASGTTKYIGATATGGGAAWNSKDQKTVVTGVEANTTNIKATASGGGAAWNSKDTKTVVTSVTASQSNLATGSVTGVQTAVTTASKAAAATTQVTTTGTGTSTTDNTDWLKGVSVSSECLIIGAAAMDTQATTQYTFTDVAVPIKDSAATTVATGQLVANGGGATIATNVSIGSSVDVIGSGATFTNTQPTIALSSGATAGTGVVNVAYNAAATGTAAVIGSSATLSNTQPTITLAQNDSSATGRAAVIVDVSATQTYIGATASGANTQWNNKDSVTVLTSATSITVTKGE